ncbi:MAG: chloride channel protein [Anaerolineae bacterium]|nr:chloride channel protein [Anaerolineae bacterium]
MDGQVKNTGTSAVFQRFVKWFSSTRLRQQSAPEWSVVMGTALVVGVSVGLASVVFRWLITQAEQLFFGVGGQVFAFLGPSYVLVIPAIGGLIVGPLIYFFAREAKGHGVPEVMAAIALRGGRIRGRVAVVKSLASAICIGSGGSVGSEGPVVQVGSALGSLLGQRLRLSDARIRTLVACGAAGGIAAQFNAPVAGAIFALEVILGEFHAAYFGAVVISAVVADVVAVLFVKGPSAFHVPEYTLVAPAELGLYAVLGVLCAAAGVVYSTAVNRMEDLFDAWKGFPEYLKASAGGLALGVIGVLMVSAGLTIDLDGINYPAAFSVGYPSIETALVGQLALGTALVLFVFKLLATAVTLGSGGSGGVFAPGLFLGAMLGAAFGQAVNTIFGGGIGPAGAYAVVGMAALFAGATHAPATAILIIFEMTGDYKIILPLMLATVVSTILARAIAPESIYTAKLVRRGIRLRQGRDIDVLQAVKVEDVMTRDVDTVPANLKLEGLVAEFERSHHHGFVVLDARGNLSGVVTLQDLDRAMGEPGWTERRVSDIATSQNLLVAYSDEPVGDALRRLGIRDVGRLPVVARDNPKRLLGAIRRYDIVRAYNTALMARTDRAQRAAQPQLEAPESRLQFVECVLTPESRAAGRAIQDLELPHDCVLVSVRRGNERTIPHGDTVLQPGDVIIAYASKLESSKLAAYLHVDSTNGR